MENPGHYLEIDCQVMSQFIELYPSVIVPVLDESPSSPFSIDTLLDDLAEVRAEVIVVFNNENVAQTFKNHPRVDHYAIMSRNVGVARAWNIGLDMARTEYSVIMNADLHVGPRLIPTLTKALDTFPDVSAVGVEGWFFDRRKFPHYQTVHKTNIAYDVFSDAVSGFLFAVRTQEFHDGLLKFDNAYTPLWFEEWDLGLQIRLMGHRNLVLARGDYEHSGGGSINSYNSISYFDQKESVESIIARNKKYFFEKWNRISALHKNPACLESGWRGFGLRATELCMHQGKIGSALKLARKLVKDFPDDEELRRELTKVVEHQTL
jgi:GT2 family glycosyltransferase